MAKYKVDEALIVMGSVGRELSLAYQSIADLLLLITYSGQSDDEGSGLITAKVFEYIAQKVPILVIGSKNWELKSDIESDNVSKLFPAIDHKYMADYILKLMQSPRRISYGDRLNVIKKYSMATQAKTLKRTVEKMCFRTKYV
jgi:hypothetical protein